jgi:hypothetical protein
MLQLSIKTQIKEKEKPSVYTMGFAAVTLGAALASVPAIAQQGVSGYSAQGAVVAIHPYRHHAH